MRRVVVTGVGGVCALGSSWPEIMRGLKACRNTIRRMDEWDRYSDMNTRLAGPITDFAPPAHWTRKQLRSMGRVSQLAVRAAELAIDDAGLAGSPVISSGETGVACGSSTGSTPDIKDFAAMIISNDASGLNANSYVRMMPHTTAANIGIFFGAQGRIIPTSSACTSGSQGIGYAYEAIKYGRQTLMLAGGAEELCATEAMAFDTLYATSRRNDSPQTTPRSYDRDRDGLVIGEGGAIMVLEELEHAQRRGARIHAELVGFGTNSDGVHVTKPEEATMRKVMELALRDAGLEPGAIGYVNGHGTATEHGDIAETRATASLFGRVPLSSQKSYLGHTLGACGALEAWFSIEMMNAGWFAPSLNLENVDPRCGELDYIVDGGRELSTGYVMNNNFAFGGVNTSMIFRRLER
ncbi:MAG TPA: beta-ketoacyl-ACP synthase [Steroidobacteraceae bacterium]|nr:beta-ketoacyl-ACP synthase [Steroidobacteraceae bacterium]